ncbi:hypothetical protein Tco_0316716 [Tanacetum coccineum]
MAAIEFGFVVRGHEFDSYPKKMICDIRSWDWFLKEHKEDSDEDDVSNEKQKREKGAANNDEDDDVWTGESEEDAELIKKLKNDSKPNYAMDVDVEDDDDDENDETLGGFIVDDEDTGEEIDENGEEDKDDE